VNGLADAVAATERASCRLAEARHLVAALVSDGLLDAEEGFSSLREFDAALGALLLLLELDLATQPEPFSGDGTTHTG
jgi:hypothetical protein